MSENGGLSRRRALGFLGAASVGSVAGCAFGRDSPVTARTSTPTSVTATTSRRTSSAETGTETVTFDGGGTSAFADALEALADSPGATLEIADGTYRFGPPSEPPPYPHFEVQNLRDNTVSGNGATFVFTDPTRGGLHVLGGEGLTIRDLTLDYDPVPFTQGTITELSDGGRTISFDVDEGYPSPTHEMFEVAQHSAATLHAPDGRFVSGLKQRGDPFKRFSSVAHLGGRRFELTLADRPGQNVRGLSVGRRLVVAARGGHGIAHGVWFTNVDGLTVENLTVHTAPGMAINGGLCSEATLRNVTVAPPSGSGRDLGSVADGINFSDAAVGPTIANCRLEVVGDDGIVVDAQLSTVTELVDDRTVVVADEGSPHVEVGDVLEVLTPAGARTGELPPVAGVEHRRQFDNPWVPDVPESVTFERPVDDAVRRGDHLANRATANRGFAVRDNTVRDTVANSVRLGSGPGVVAGNRLDGCALHGVWLHCDTSSGSKPKRWSNDVVIRDNRITRSGLTFFAADGAAAVTAEHSPGEGVTTEGRPHRNVSLVGNEIRNCASLGLELEHTEGLRLRENAVRDTNRLVYRRGGGFGVGFDAVADVDVTANSVAGSGESLYQFGRRTRTEGLVASDNRLSIDGRSVPPRVVTWARVALSFDGTVEPAGGDRHIAFRCFELALLDDRGASVVAVDVGGREMPVEFGDGVYSVDRGADRRWRWFGGRTGTAVLYFAEADLEDAARLRLRGMPAEAGISARVVVGGRATDEVTFRAPGERSYAVSVDGG